MEEDAILLEELTMRQANAEESVAPESAAAKASSGATLDRESFLKEEQDAIRNTDAKVDKESSESSESSSSATAATAATSLPVNRNDDNPKEQEQQSQQSLLRATRETFQKEEEAVEQQQQADMPSPSRRLRTATTTTTTATDPTQQTQQDRRRTTTYLENLNQRTHSVAIQSFHHEEEEAPNRPLVETNGKRLNKVALQMLYEEELLEEMLDVVNVAQMSMTR